MALQVSIAIIINGENLTFQLRKKNDYQGYLGLLGGKVEHGETADQAVIREVREESGLDVLDCKHVGTVIEYLESANNSKEINLQVFEVRTRGDAQHNHVEGEIVEVPKDYFVEHREKFIPTDWLIVRKFLDQQLVDFKIKVSAENKTYDIVK